MIPILYQNIESRPGRIQRGDEYLAKENPVNIESAFSQRYMIAPTAGKIRPPFAFK